MPVSVAKPLFLTLSPAVYIIAVLSDTEPSAVPGIDQDEVFMALL